MLLAEIAAYLSNERSIFAMHMAALIIAGTFPIAEAGIIVEIIAVITAPTSLFKLCL